MMTPASRSLQALVFDFDGVIADTERLHLLAFRDVLGSRGVDLDAPDYYERYLGFDDRGVFGALARDRGLAWTDDQLARLVQAKAERFRAVIEATPVVFDGVARLVSSWARDVPYGAAAVAVWPPAGV